MTLLFLVVFLTTPSIATFIWYGLPTIAILTRKMRFYFWIAILAGLGTIGIVTLTLISSENIPADGIIRIIMFFSLLLPAAFLAIWLPNKLTPEPEEQREFYENEFGAQRSRIVFKFSE